MNALPLGNGRIAAMVYGHPDIEKIEINEESLWSGRQIKEKNTATRESLEEIRRLLFAEENEEAARLADKTFTANPPRLRFYESFGEITIDYADKKPYYDYRKELDLSEGLVRVSYAKYRTAYQSESFVSEKDNVFAYKMQTSEGQPFSCSVSVSREQDAYTAALDDNTLIMKGRITYHTVEHYGEGGEGMRFAAKLRVVTDGTCRAAKKKIEIENATSVVIFAGFATNYSIEKFDIDETIQHEVIVDQAISAALSDGYEKLKKMHVDTHRAQYERVSLSINDSERNQIPTDVRLEVIKSGEWDDSFFVLYFNFSRYLLLCSSGKNAVLPANLQGKWCHGFMPPWGSDYHTNINIQMNYWPALPLNMAETMTPFIHFVEKVSQYGRCTAKELYGASGWVVHHNTDIFGRTGIHDGAAWGTFPLGALWLCLNLWEWYEFTAEQAALEEIYPVLKSACKFVLDFLVESPEGYLVTNPSNSPENTFYYTDRNGEKKKSMFTYGATMDFQIIFCMFVRMLYACRSLKTDKVFAEKIEKTLEKLPPLRISERYGTICEWIKDYEEVEPGHRHISHLFGLFPGDQINETEPLIFEAAKKTIQRRLSHGGGATGWSRAWIINFYARLKDGDAALEHLQALMMKSTASNLFDMHPPFQIDGNFGAISGIAEMLLQSHLGEIGRRVVELLPALPEKWQQGKVSGLRARGNFEIDIIWERGKARQAKIRAFSDGVFRLKLNGRTADFRINAAYDEQEGIVSIPMKKGSEEIIYFNEGVLS